MHHLQDARRPPRLHVHATRDGRAGTGGAASRTASVGRPGDMSVRTRLAVAFLAISLLIPLVGLVAVRQQYTVSKRAAQLEARHVAEPIAHTIANSAALTNGAALTKGDQRHLYQDEKRLRQYLDDLQRELRRHVEVIDSQQRVLAAASPGKGEGEAEARRDIDAEVAATIRDGQPRTFVERDKEFPAGTLQVVIPLRSAQSRIVGAVVMEYTPLYRELLAAGAATRRAIVAASVAGLLLGLLLAYGLARGLVRDLHRLGQAAGRLGTATSTSAPRCAAAGSWGSWPPRSTTWPHASPPRRRR
ncbi:MAG TPA: hypothetical protein VG276_10150 [Actinomycetes bacterium]|nr:hypothetical protein [Actinomycetes bacterium]